MPNYYADAIDVIANDLTIQEAQRVAVAYARAHPKAFVEAAATAGNKVARKAIGDYSTRGEVCETCAGTGKVIRDENRNGLICKNRTTCPDCDGRGTV